VGTVIKDLLHQNQILHDIAKTIMVSLSATTAI
jgi:23S rRNA maturation-related 3'-5' exoribonuclease YhaM